MIFSAIYLLMKFAWFGFVLVTAVLSTSCSVEHRPSKVNGMIEQTTAAHSLAASSTPRSTSVVNTQNTWIGTYQGVIPCQNCEGVLIELTLNADSSYYLSEKYLNRDHHHQPLDTVGLYHIDENHPNTLLLDAAASHRKISQTEQGSILLSGQQPTHSFKLLKTS